MKAVDFFRALDDSDLDPYETRFLLRVWRRGQCWESPDSIAESTGMSRRKVYQVRKKLLETGWLVLVEVPGHLAYQVAIPAAENAVEIEESNVVDVHEVHTDAVVSVHDVHKVVHHVHKPVHQVHALPINRTKEDYPSKYIHAPEAAASGNGAGEEDDGWKQEAWEAIVDLIEFWEQLTRRKAPPQKSDVFRDSWLKPFNEIWIACGHDVDAAKAKIQAVRNDMLAQGLTILNPAKLPGHVQTMIDRELLPLTQRMNGNGHVNFKNDPEAREAHNRAVFDQVAREIEKGEWSPWTI